MACLVAARPRKCCPKPLDVFRFILRVCRLYRVRHKDLPIENVILLKKRFGI